MNLRRKFLRADVYDRIGSLEPEIIPATEAPRDLYEDDKGAALRDEWAADEREWLQDFREECRR